MALALWLVLATITAAVGLMLLCVCQCATRCFRPQNARGAAWFMDRNGKEQLVKGVFEGGDGWLKPKTGPAPPAAPAALPTLPVS
jgi:hypothetical protein